MLSSEVSELRVIETGKRGIELQERGGDGEIGAVSKVLAALEFKGGKLSATANFALLKPFYGIRFGPPPLQMASQ